MKRPGYWGLTQGRVLAQESDLGFDPQVYIKKKYFENLVGIQKKREDLFQGGNRASYFLQMQCQKTGIMP